MPVGCPDISALGRRPEAIPTARERSDLGRAAEERGDAEGALALFQAAIALQPGRSRYLIDAARVLIQLRRLDEAEPLLQEVLAKQPGHARALRDLARVATARGDVRTAVELLREAAANAPENVSILVDYGDALREAGHPDEAAEAYRAAGVLDPRSERVGRRIAGISREPPDDAGQAEAGRPEQAAPSTGEPPFSAVLPGALAPGSEAVPADTDREAELRAALARLEAMPPTIESLTEIARLALSLGHTARAEQAYLDLRVQKPTRVLPVLQLSRLARDRDDPAAAERHLRDGIASGIRDSRLFLDLARVLRNGGRLNEAYDAYAAALSTAPDEPRAAQELREMLRESGGIPAALPQLEAVEAAGNHAPALRCLRIDLLLEIDRPEAARSLAEEALRSHGPSVDILLRLGAMERASGDGAAGLERLRAAHRLDPGSADAVVSLGRALLSDDLLDELGGLTVAVTAGQQIALARALRLDGRGDLARLLLGQVGARMPTAVPDLLALGSECAAAGLTKTSEKVLHRAADAMPDDPDAWLGLGRLWRTTQGPGTAEGLRALRRAVDLAPQRAEPRAELARDLLEIGRAEEAEAALRDALDREPDHLPALQVAHRLLRALGHDGAAALLCDRIRAERPGAGWAWSAAVDARCRIGAWEEALALLDEMDARKIVPDAARVQRIGILFRRGRTAEALRLLEAAREARPADAALWWLQIEHWIRTGRTREAAEALDDAPLSERGRTRFLHAQALVAEAEWRMEDAARLATSAVRADPRHGAALETCVRTCLSLNRPRDARAWLSDQAADRLSRRLPDARVPRVSSGFLGRLTEEYLLDAELEEVLHRAQALPFEARLPALVDACRTWPDQTSAAMALLLHLRRAGLLEAGADRPGPDARSPIPQRVIQYWQDPVPPADVDELMRSWAETNPHYAYRRFDATSAYAYLQAHASPDVCSAFRLARQAAEQADLFRLAVLAREGGFYADADDRCLTPLDALRDRFPTACLLTQERMANLGNNIIGAAPGHALIESALRQAADALNRGDRSGPWLDTGPGMLSRCFVAQLLRPGAGLMDGLRDVTILPLPQLRQSIAVGLSAGYKSTGSYWQNHARSPVRREVTPRLRRALRLPTEGDGDGPLTNGGSEPAG
ncbi:tetratricopeptide repeat protein [Muricoccus radiodurans]|uniref:tetratricopeptide repeat protein n=1 Tax=Muricoccus radiodurans TaxID=2231721 RepID=UPI003CE9663B